MKRCRECSVLLLRLLLLVLSLLSLRWIQADADTKSKTDGRLIACRCERAPSRRVGLVYIRLLKLTGRQRPSALGFLIHDGGRALALLVLRGRFHSQPSKLQRGGCALAAAMQGAGARPYHNEERV